MNSKMIFGLFVAMALAQVAVPMGQIRKYEEILATGTAYKFRTAPVDPYDAFRGRYAALNYADTLGTIRQGDEMEYGASAYVALQKDTSGFAKFGELSDAPPATGDYLRVAYLYYEQERKKAHFRLPFDRYYMEEKKAPEAEAAYRKYGNRRDRADGAAYVAVRIKGGRGVIENLYINDKPIRDFLAEEAAIQ